mgnify:CR=1 FL=1
MAVVIDNVYQKVLALANKEQRGYITPQEFNLFADRAQNEIYENYFYQLSVAEQKPKNQMQQSDSKEVIEQKLSFFIEADNISVSNAANGSVTLLAANISDRRIIKITTTAQMTTVAGGSAGKIVERISSRELDYILENPLTAPTLNRQVYVYSGDDGNGNPTIRIYPVGYVVTNSHQLEYYREPSTPNWGYVVVNEKALYNAGASTNFELHVSEEENLVNKILMLAGITIQKPELQQAGAGQMQITQQQQNS